MIISVTVIKKPRRLRICPVCDKYVQSGPCLKIFGAEGIGSKPYTIYQHINCSLNSENEKVIKALVEALL